MVQLAGDDEHRPTLTLAVVDDLLAITIIAVFYSSELDLLFLVAALFAVAVFAIVVRRTTAWWALLPVAAVTWTLMHEAGVHATVAGVLLGFVVPAVARDGESEALTHRFEHTVRPLSQLIALPLFAFFASGVVIGGADGLRTLGTDPLPLGILAGLLLVKVLGIWGTKALVVRLTPLRLDSTLRHFDVLPVALLAGIGQRERVRGPTPPAGRVLGGYPSVESPMHAGEWCRRGTYPGIEP